MITQNPHPDQKTEKHFSKLKGIPNLEDITETQKNRRF